MTQKRLSQRERSDNWYINFSDGYAINLVTKEKKPLKNAKKFFDLSTLLFLKW